MVTTGQSIDLECMLKRPTDYSLRITVRFLSNMTDKFLNSREVNGQGHYKVATKKKTRVLTILKVNEDTEGDYRCIGVDIVSDEDLVGPYRKLRIASKKAMCLGVCLYLSVCLFGWLAGWLAGYLSVCLCLCL